MRNVVLSYPAKKAPPAKVPYTAAFEFADVLSSTWPPAPRPFKALNRPRKVRSIISFLGEKLCWKLCDKHTYLGTWNIRLQAWTPNLGTFLSVRWVACSESLTELDLSDRMIIQPLEACWALKNFSGLRDTPARLAATLSFELWVGHVGGCTRRIWPRSDQPEGDYGS